MSEKDVLAAIAGIPMEFERVRDELAEGVIQYHNAIPLQGARVITVGTAGGPGLPGGRTLACAAAGRLVGWSLRATGGHVTVVMRDGRDIGGDPIGYCELDDTRSETIWLGSGGISFTDGLYVQVLGAGTAQGAVYLGAVD